jgi:hypothetical protein
MSAQGECIVAASYFVRKLRGGSQPVLVAGTDSRLYVLKFNNNCQGPHIPFNEVAGTELYKACGLAVPEWRAMLVSDHFLDNNPGCWMETPDGSKRPETGICFASRFLGTPGNDLLEILPGSNFQRICNRTSFWFAWLLDVCCDHADNRQAVFERDSNGRLNAHFIDMGHMFGGPRGEFNPLPAASRYIDPRIYTDIPYRQAAELLTAVRALNLDELRSRMLGMPADWTLPAALRCFDRCIDRLHDNEIIRDYLEVILDSRLRAGKGERRGNRISDSTGPALLHPRISPESGAIIGWRTGQCCRLACG